MEEKNILSISLASLLKMYPPQPEDLYYDGCILGHRHKVKTEKAMNLFRFPTRINAFGSVFCSKGSISITSNLRHCTIGPKMMFMYPPGTIIQVDSQEGAVVHFILCEEDFIKRINIDLKQLMHLFIFVRKPPILKLNDSEWQEIMRSIEDTFTEGCKHQSDTLSTEIMHSLFRILCYRICRAIDYRIEKYSDEPSDISSSHNRNATYFNSFLEELSKNYMQERSVGFYAGKLHLTPKYLTTLIRQTTGRTASEWIDEYVILEAKNLLKYSTMNIQEIAYYLNFPNQSFFGHYFKKHTGMSPSSYRTFE